MLSKAEITASFGRSEGNARALQQHVDEILRQYSVQHGYLYSSRLKASASFLQKLETGRMASLVCADLLACTLVVPTLNDIESCIDGLPARVQLVDRAGPRTRAKEPSVFMFDDEQLACRLVPPTGVEELATTIWALNFELQIKTVTQHAWGQATHDLVYKGDEFDWRRVRLSAQLRALAEQADLLYAEFLNVAPNIQASRSERSDHLSLVNRYLASWIRHGRVPSVAQPPSPVRFAESVVELAQRVGVPVSRACRLVTFHLKRHGLPVSLSLFQLCQGVVITAAGAANIDWADIAGEYWLFVTREGLDLFPALGEVPLENTVR